ncbi:MAG: tRNA U34 5-carboxymethylaminomethyl modifying GTPase MnmE/TrmE [Maribacter sp.]|jgi:tRNA U34 5-carboxymethylaminomethyl modifying GTPase MnmE/TrmE
MADLLNDNLRNLRAQLDEIIKDLHRMTVGIGNDPLATTVSELRNRINEPFMFVVVGEVKAGKSSFVNALLGENVCKVAPDPCTDTIQQILYGEEVQVVGVNPHLKKIYTPAEILKEIAIVDTPGTNTISAHHQEITESFIPASDLIVFVFEAKNPYRQSAWEFLDFIRDEWRKKVIFVLQQKDLMEPEDLVINESGVFKYAQKKGVNDAKIYSVSAKLEMKGDTENSGYPNLRKYIADNITGGKAPVLKLDNNIATSINISDRINDGLRKREEQYLADENFRKDVSETLDKQQGKSNYQVDVLTENILTTYDKVTGEIGDELSQGLSFVSVFKKAISSIFNKDASTKGWIDELKYRLEHELKDQLTEKLNMGVNDLTDSVSQMVSLIDMKIKSNQTVLKGSDEIFSHIANKRNSVMDDLRDTFNQFMKRSENFEDDEVLPSEESFSPNIATGSGLAVIGMVIAAVTQGAVFDITGGILTTVGVLFAGITVGIGRKKILGSYKNEIERGRKKLESEVDDKLKLYVSNVKEKVEGNFKEFDLMLEHEGEQTRKISVEHHKIATRLKEMRGVVQQEMAMI